VVDVWQRRIRAATHVRGAGRFIAALWIAGVSVGLGAYAPPVPEVFFAVSYAMLIVGIAWGVAFFLTSGFLRLQKWSVKKTYRGWVTGVTSVVVALGVFFIIEVHSIQDGRELLKLNGILIPANDPDPPGPCDKYPARQGALKVYLGGVNVVGYGTMIRVIELLHPPSDTDPVLLGISRASDGSAALHAHATGKHGEVVADIDRNYFRIRRNSLFDPLSAPRPDKSTIRLTDDDGNELTVRFMNSRSISFSGKLYLNDRTFVQIDEKGIWVHPKGFGISPGHCLLLSNPNGAGAIGIE